MVNPGQYVNKVGKYLRKNIDGAYKIAFAPEQCDVFMKMYYQTPGDPDSFSEMDFIISIATYANKLRVNITENDANEKTIGQLVLDLFELNDLGTVKAKVMNKLTKSIVKEYSEYDFVY